MSESLLSIDALNLPGDELTVMPLRSFVWGTADGSPSSLLRLVAVRLVDELSAGIALLQQSGEARAATLTRTDDAGESRLQVKFTAARVVSYSVTGDEEDVREQFTLEAASVDMTTGSFNVTIG